MIVVQYQNVNTVSLHSSWFFDDEKYSMSNSQIVDLCTTFYLNLFSCLGEILVHYQMLIGGGFIPCTLLRKRNLCSISELSTFHWNLLNRSGGMEQIKKHSNSIIYVGLMKKIPIQNLYKFRSLTDKMTLYFTLSKKCIKKGSKFRRTPCMMQLWFRLCHLLVKTTIQRGGHLSGFQRF